MSVESSKVKSLGYGLDSRCLSWECFHFQTVINCQSIFQTLSRLETSVMLNWLPILCFVALLLKFLSIVSM